MHATHVMIVALAALLLAVGIEYANATKQQPPRPIGYGNVFIVFIIAFGFGAAALFFFSSTDDASGPKPDLFKNVRQGDPQF